MPPIDKNGISQRFLAYFKTFDQQAGARALGPEKTLSGKVQETIAQATEQAKAVDEHRGISKTFSEVRVSPIQHTHTHRNALSLYDFFLTVLEEYFIYTTR